MPRVSFSRLKLGPSVPEHALHEKDLQGQKGVDTLVRSQKRSALLAPLINQLSTAVFVPLPIYIKFRMVVLLKNSSTCLFGVWEGTRAGSLLGEPILRPPVLPPRSAPTFRRAPPRPELPVVCPGFGIDRV